MDESGDKLTLLGVTRRMTPTVVLGEVLDRSIDVERRSPKKIKKKKKTKRKQESKKETRREQREARRGDATQPHIDDQART